MTEELKSEESTYGHFLLHDIYIFYAISIIAALSRIIVRCTITRRLALEEAVMLFLICCYTAYVSCVHIYLKYGTNLMTPSERFVMLMNPGKLEERIRGSKASIAAWFLYCTCIWGCKTCIWMVCKRLTDRTSSQKRRVLYTGYLIVGTYSASILALFCICIPFAHYWRVEPAPGNECSDGYHTMLIIGSLNVISDIPLLAIPIPIVMKLQVGWRQKTALFFLFGVGVCAVAAAFGRMVEVSFSSLSGPSTFWALTETTCAFVVTNLPGIQSAFTFCIERRKEIRSAHRAEAAHSQSYAMRNTPRPQPRNHFRQFSDESLMHSEEHLVIVAPSERAKNITTDLTIVTHPLPCELEQVYEVERAGESLPDLETGGVRPHVM